MKKIKAIGLFLAIFVIALVVVGCGKSENSIVGTWTSESGSFVYTFNEDGTGDYSGAAFTYTTVDDKLSITYNGSTSPFETTYTIDGNTLNVKDSFGNDTIYKRK